MKKDTHLEFAEKLKSKYGDRYTLLSEYINSCSNVKVRCNKCGAVTKKQAGKLLYRGGCRKCSSINHTKTHDEFVKQIRERHGDKITILSQYTYDRDKILVRHNECGAENWVTASSIVQRISCKSCQNERSHNRYVKAQEEFIKDVFKKHGNDYTVIGQYYNAQTNILVRHNICGNEWEVRPIQLLINIKRCPACQYEHLRCSDPKLRRLIRGIRIRIIHVLQGRTKSKPTLALLGVESRHELKKYIESNFDDGMSWDNYGEGWHIDHIRPVASFDLTDPAQQALCFHHTNLQPLWREHNQEKSSWYKGQRYREGEPFGTQTAKTV